LRCNNFKQPMTAVGHSRLVRTSGRSRDVRNARAPWKGGAFPAGASPARQPLQPEATGAAMEATKWLKLSVSGSRFGDLRECTGRNASERRANLEKDNA
jgi:hypothetical protein